MLFPGAWVLVGIWALQQDTAVRTASVPYAIYFCYGALAAAALISWYYDYARLFCVALSLGLAIWAVRRIGVDADLARSAVIVILPLNFVLFASVKERGIVTAESIVAIIFLCAQFLGLTFYASEFDHWFSSTHATQASWAPWIEPWSFVLAALVLLGFVVWRRTKVEHGLFWALMSAGFGVILSNTPEALLFYGGAGGLILFFAVLEHGHDIAYLDELTGLPGRRAFNQHLARLGKRYCIAMCDVDHFKKFNDTHGHDAGDQALKMVAAKLAQVEGGGRPFRYGGEEFVLVFRGRTAKEAQPFIEAMRIEIAENTFVLRGSNRPKIKPVKLPDTGQKSAASVTVSIGAAERSERYPTPQLVMDAADAALYRAKESGRNRVVVAGSTVETPVLESAEVIR